MANLFTILLLFCNVIVTFVSAYQNHDQIDYSDSRHEAKMKLMQPSSDLGGMNINPNDLAAQAKLKKFNLDLENWTGRWMPDYDAQLTTIPSIISESDIGVHDSISMYRKHADCDDGKTKLFVDWNNSPVNYTCYGGKIAPSYDISPILYCEHIPPFYKPIHRCMNYTIEYDDNIPVYGNHRPVWPAYGEYKFLPRQRWIHSLEHGAVVMLYHPCANPLEVQLLKDIVTNCLRRHIITRYNLLDVKRPLALATWGCRLTMSYVDKDIVRNFIRNKAIKGPENIANDGEFIEGRLIQAKIVSDKYDSQLCPHLE